MTISTSAVREIEAAMQTALVGSEPEIGRRPSANQTVSSARAGRHSVSIELQACVELKLAVAALPDCPAFVT